METCNINLATFKCRLRVESNRATFLVRFIKPKRKPKQTHLVITLTQTFMHANWHRKSAGKSREPTSQLVFVFIWLAKKTRRVISLVNTGCTSIFKQRQSSPNPELKQPNITLNGHSISAPRLSYSFSTNLQKLSLKTGRSAEFTSLGMLGSGTSYKFGRNWNRLQLLNA